MASLEAMVSAQPEAGSWTAHSTVSSRCMRTRAGTTASFQLSAGDSSGKPSAQKVMILREDRPWGLPRACRNTSMHASAFSLAY
jgi:hypothetical protein